MKTNPPSPSGAPPAADPAPLPPAWLRGLAAVVLAAGVLLGLLPLAPPATVPAAAPPERFSAGRALEHVRILARAPRPMGSPAHAAARRHLVAAVEAQGVPVEVQEAVVVEPFHGGDGDSATVRNVVARLEGTGDAPTTLLMAHYDSVANSPGAADDAAGVAALLEVMRALTAGPALPGDVLFLFTDGEEPGRYGARAFLERHRWASEVDRVVNLEARGNRGPALMFETGPGTGPALLRALAGAGPVASSYSREVYRRLPNDTDMTVFREAGLPGFNFATIHGAETYHGSRDTADRLDPRSVQHHGEQALALARELSGAEAPEEGGAAIYFNLPLLGLIVYPEAAAPWIAVLVLLLAVAAVAVLRSRRAPLAMLVWIAAWVVAAALGYAVAALRLLPPAGGALGLWIAGWALLGAAVAAGAWAVAARRAGTPALAAGACLLWAALGLGAALALPGASYLLAWPAAAGCLALWLLRPGAAVARPAPRILLLAAAALPLLLLWSPLVALVGVALGAVAAPVISLLAAVATSLLAPQLAAIAGRRRWLPALALGLAGVVLAVGALAGLAPGEPPPHRDSLFYVLDADGDDAWWASFDSAPDAWTARVLGEDGRQLELAEGVLGTGPATLLAAEAPAAPLAPPEIAGQELAAAPGGRRVLRLRIASPRPESRLRVELRSADPLRLRTIGGRPVESDVETAERWTFLHDGPAEGPAGGRPTQEQSAGAAAGGDSLEIVVEAGAAPVEVVVADRTYALPGRQGLPAAGDELPPRPEGVLPIPHGATDFTSVRASARF